VITHRSKIISVLVTTVMNYPHRWIRSRNNAWITSPSLLAIRYKNYYY